MAEYDLDGVDHAWVSNQMAKANGEPVAGRDIHGVSYQRYLLCPIALEVVDGEARGIDCLNHDRCTTCPPMDLMFCKRALEELVEAVKKLGYR